jgi:hypothetical protein
VLCGTRAATRVTEMSSPTNLRDVRLAPPSHFWSRSGFVLAGLLACILAFALAGVIAIAQFPFADRGHQLAIRADPTTPQLVVQSSHGMSGEPAPLGLEVQGLAEGAVVLIRGLVPGMNCQPVAQLAAIPGSCLPGTCTMLGSPHLKVLSVRQISLPSCACPTTKLLIEKPYTSNG